MVGGEGGGGGLYKRPLSFQKAPDLSREPRLLHSLGVRDQVAGVGGGERAGILPWLCSLAVVVFLILPHPTFIATPGFLSH